MINIAYANAWLYVGYHLVVAHRYLSAALWLPNSAERHHGQGANSAPEFGADELMVHWFLSGFLNVVMVPIGCIYFFNICMN